MTIRDLLLARADQDTPALLTRERTWTWRELVADASARAAALGRLLDPERPPHVGLLMDNTAEMLLGLAAAGLGGHVAVGINSTRRGEAIVADLARADVQVLLTDATQRHLLAGLDLPGIQVIDTDSADWAGAVGVVERVEATSVSSLPQRLRPSRWGDPQSSMTDKSLFMLIFTSGTSGRPKAVRITHEKVTHPGAYLSERFGLTADDVHYVAMPLFHSNAVMAGWAPALVTGAAVALREKFSSSEFLPDVRRFGATYASYVGKPLTYVLATPERPDDADNPLRLVFGNEAGDRDIRAFGERFGCVVVDGFGSTENAVIVSRIEGTPAGALGWPGDGVAVLDPETGAECPRAELAPDGQVLNLEECVGELVNTTGAGQFAGYYNDDEATAERMRGGMYWSGDLAYRDAEGWVWFAGRTAAWLRVDGENLACAPIERILLRHPAIDQAAVYAVPDERSGDQVAAALVLRGELGPSGFEEFLDEQADLSPKARPRYVRLVDDLPRTATHKVLHRDLTAAGIAEATWTREERGTTYA
ncbi:AMP-binding protein [Aeromicrobium ginsengisoli]|uniref:AMP-binding protein n=1 Tax=Aeromicrobium ginsengisoli TaxID=363867 RepID=A0A5M4FDL5_9ACTN|nr:AMP-binding protein [Aeromicrobium ginsengisoli]KAA1395970.1 AMP-binding protein [Aeromicrobium ginsengisoli]